MANFCQPAEEKRILNVGLACLDIVMVCSEYPEEDTDQRCVSHEWRRGGNASNSSTVMAEFRVPCEYFGTLSTDHSGKFLKQDFELRGIHTSNCIFYNEYSSPTSVVLISAVNGSRTIIHSNKNLPELTFDDFKKLDLQIYKWIHFEARPSTDEIKKMIKHIESWNLKECNNKITISIEVEKGNPSYVNLLGYGNIVFISKDFARACGYDSMVPAVEALVDKLPNGSTLICPWGEYGACAKMKGEKLISAPAYPPKKVIDTLGAGDTFVSTTVFCLANNYDVECAICRACQVAGVKCGIEGFNGLSEFFPQIFDS